MSNIAGIDVGGTFTDLIYFDEITSEIRLAKVPTTVNNQAYGVVAALEEAAIDLSQLSEIVHGTTTTTNAILERKIAVVGMITTQGFRDVIEVGRRTRPTAYGLTGKFEPLISREMRLEVAERTDATGNVLTPLDETGVERATRELLDKGAEAVVIHFLHSYINPKHELRAAAIVRSLWPNPYVTVGHKIIGKFREYERGTTAAVNASVQPVLGRYISRLANELRARNFTKELLVMQGNGGTISADNVAETAANTVMSGPASGVIAAAYIGKAAGFPNIISYDMGGTSSDVSLIRNGMPQISAELELEYAMPVHVPMVDVHTIGAGGGSIAFINNADLLQVGPESAGAAPGPICYGRGGTRPTITDANLLLGRLSPFQLLSVEQRVSVETVSQAIESAIGKPLGLNAEAAALAILRIANERMASAIRLVSLSRGHDPRDFALFAFGGAGPLHAVALARELGVPRIIIPARPGLTNALGCVIADLRHDFVHTLNRPLAAINDHELRDIIRDQIAAGEAEIARDNVGIEGLEFLHSADMQFQGQSHILTVEISGSNISVSELSERFEAAYLRRFDLRLPEMRPVLVSLHTAALGQRRKPALDKMIGKSGTSRNLNGAGSSRRVRFADDWHQTKVYQRDELGMGTAFNGPAIVEQLDTTIVIEPDNSVVVDELGNLIVSLV